MWSGISTSRSAIDCRKVDCERREQRPPSSAAAPRKQDERRETDLSAAVLSEKTVALAVAAVGEIALVSLGRQQLRDQPGTTHLRVTSAFSTRTRPWNESEYESIRMSRPLASEARTPVADLRDERETRSALELLSCMQPGWLDAPVGGSVELGHRERGREVLGRLVGGPAGERRRHRRLGGRSRRRALALLGGALSGLSGSAARRAKESERRGKVQGSGISRSAHTLSWNKRPRRLRTYLLRQTLNGRAARQARRTSERGRRGAAKNDISL